LSKDEVITNSVRKTNKRALVIAVSEYNSPTLKSIGFCKNDGQEMSDVLKKLGYDIPDNRRLIGLVNYQILKKAIYDFFTNEGNKPDDTLVFYYSGHGVPDRWGTPYLAPSDIDSDRPFITGFSFDDLTNSMLESNSLSVVTILDSCYSGSLKISKGLDAKGGEEGATRIANKMIEEKSNKLQQGIGRCLLASSQGYEEAYDRQEKDHSIFTFYLLEGLKGSKDALDDEGNVTYDTLGKCITKEFANLPSSKRPKQTPIRKGEVSGGEIVLANYPEFRRIKEDYYSLFGKGENFYRDNKYREALECYNAILQTRPEDQFTLLRIGDILFNLNEDKKSLECFNRLIELNDSNSDAWYYKAQLHLKTKDYENAYKCLDQATSISPNDEKIWESYKMAKSLLRSSRKLGKRGSIARQEEIPVPNKSEKENTIDKSVSIKENFQANAINNSSEKTIDTSPNKFTALNNEGRTLYNDGKYEEAIQYFDEALQIDPYNEDTIYNKFRALERLPKDVDDDISKDQITKKVVDDSTTSDRLDDNALDKDPNLVKELMNKGRESSKQGKYEEAMAWYHKALAIDNNNVSALNDIAALLHEQGKYQEAIAWYDKALAIDPNFEIARYNKKLVLDLTTGKTVDTYTYSNVRESNVRELINKGLESSKQGKYEEAIACYDKALAIDNNDVSALYNKGIVLHNQGKYEEAIVWYDKALAIEPYFEEAKLNKKLALKVLKTVKTYSNVKIEATELSEELASYLQNRGFKVTYTPDHQNNTYFIRAYNTGTVRRIVGMSKSVDIRLRGISPNLEIALSTGEFKENLLSQVAISAPLSVFTLGIPTAAAVGTTYYVNKKFKDELWEFIESKIL
jgi:tetratricopeptide (TPR) repeat protein